VDLMPELGYAPTNKYLPPRAAPQVPTHAMSTSSSVAGIKGWINKMIAR
jgi:hypothetical protein